MSGTKPGRDETSLFRIVQAIRELFEGRSDAIGEVTLTAGAASTAVTAATCGEDSVVKLTPRTANAAAELGNGTLYVSQVARGSFTLAHANNAQTDRTFDWSLQG